MASAYGGSDSSTLVNPYVYIYTHFASGNARRPNLNFWRYTHAAAAVAFYATQLACPFLRPTDSNSATQASIAS